jgi:hypothetical protein
MWSAEFGVRNEGREFNRETCEIREKGRGRPQMNADARGWESRSRDIFAHQVVRALDSKGGYAPH